MNITPLKSNFSAGELSPLMVNRTELQGFDASVAVMRNCISLPQGPTFSRFPFTFFVNIAGAANARLETLDYTDNLFVIIVFLNLQVRFFLNDGTELPGATTPYPDADLDDLYFIESPGGNVFYVTHQNHFPRVIEYDDVAGTVSFTIMNLNPDPPEWEPGNYPACGVVNRQRLWFANTPKQPEQYWASRVADPFDFVVGPQEEDSFSVVNEHYGAIEWMLSTKDLIVGTENAEYIITSQGPVIFIGDIAINRQSTYGSSRVSRARQIGDRIIYTSRDSEKLYGMQYSDNAANWLSEEFSFPSSHVLAPKIKDSAWEQHPVSLYWLVLKDGTMACMSYNSSLGIVGWHRHDTQGQFLSIATGTVSGETSVVAIVDRGNGLNLEISNGEGFPMDSRIDVDLGSPGTVVTGLDPLEGFDCQVIADGAVHPNRTVTGGSITLQLPATLVQVGLGYRKQIKTLNLDKGAQAGSARSYTKRYKDIYLDLIYSAIPSVNGRVPPIRRPAVPMNTAPPLTTGLVKVANLGWDKDAQIDIIQDGPLPLGITGIYGEVKQEKI